MDIQKRRPRKKKPSSEESSQTTIDDLPEAILIHILSFLTTTEAVKTSAVTPAWRSLWLSVPTLDFNIDHFHCCMPDKSTPYARQRFAEFINQIFLRRHRHSPLQKFKLYFPHGDYEPFRLYVNCWLQLVISSKAVELDLNFFPSRFHPDIICTYEYDDDDDTVLSDYEFHFSDLMNSSVKVLKLGGCHICLPSSALSMKFDSIREMDLDHFSSTDEEIEHLMASCVNLEILSLGSGYLLHNLKIVSQKLKHLKLQDVFDEILTENTSVEICAPSLESIEFHDTLAGNYALKDASSSLVEAYLDFNRRSQWELAGWTNVIRFLSGVKRLTIQNMWTWFLEESIASNTDDIKKKPKGASYVDPYEGECFGKLNLAVEVFSETFVFHNLKDLELRTGYSRDEILGLEVLLRKCPQLETMVLVYSYQSRYDGRLKKKMTGRSVVLQMPHIRLVKMKEYTGSKDESYVVRLLKKHGVVLEKIIAFPVRDECGTPCPPFVL